MKNNNQQSNKATKVPQKSRDALQCVSTKNCDGRDAINCDGSGASRCASTKNVHTALKVNNVSKIFKIPHKKIDSMRSAFVNAFSKKTYEEFYALKNINFEVKKGEFLGIIGHNGAGKSTLLKILAGVYKPSKGSIEVNGMISPFLELGIGFNPELSGRDNVYLNATVLGLSREQIDKKYQEIVEFAELENFMDEQIKNYSSGMQARLAFSVSIHADREILLMDEVLAVGDTRFAQKCLNIFRGYKNQGKTVILVTHSTTTVQEYCDRALLLHKGKIRDIGNVDDVCDKYLLTNLTENQQRELQKQQKREKQAEEKKKEEMKRKKMQKNNKSSQNKITDIKIFDKNGNNLTTLTRNDDFYVEVYLDIVKIRANFILAIQIFDNNNNKFLCGNNTEADNFNCEWNRGKNIFKLYFTNTMFNMGEIYIKAILFQKKGKINKVLSAISTKEINDYVIKIKKQEGSGAGIMYIKHDWQKK